MNSNERLPGKDKKSLFARCFNVLVSTSLLLPIPLNNPSLVSAQAAENQKENPEAEITLPQDIQDLLRLSPPINIKPKDNSDANIVSRITEEKVKLLEMGFKLSLTQIPETELNPESFTTSDKWLEFKDGPNHHLYETILKVEKWLKEHKISLEYKEGLHLWTEDLYRMVVDSKGQRTVHLPYIPRGSQFDLANGFVKLMEVKAQRDLSSELKHFAKYLDESNINYIPDPQGVYFQGGNTITTQVTLKNGQTLNYVFIGDGDVILNFGLFAQRGVFQEKAEIISKLSEELTEEDKIFALEFWLKFVDQMKNGYQGKYERINYLEGQLPTLEELEDPIIQEEKFIEFAARLKYIKAAITASNLSEKGLSKVIFIPQPQDQMHIDTMFFAVKDKIFVSDHLGAQGFLTQSLLKDPKSFINLNLKDDTQRFFNGFKNFNGDGYDPIRGSQLETKNQFSAYMLELQAILEREDFLGQIIPTPFTQQQISANGLSFFQVNELFILTLSSGNTNLDQKTQEIISSNLPETKVSITFIPDRGFTFVNDITKHGIKETFTGGSFNCATNAALEGKFQSK